MKRTLAWILVVAMLACMLPAFTFAVTAAEGEEVQSGLNAKIYQMIALEGVMPYNHDRYYDIVGTTSDRGARCSFDDTVRFANALPTLLYTSKEDPSKAETDLEALTGWFDANGYLVKWEGTITADATGEYTLVGRKIDNGFLAYIDQNGDGEFAANEIFYDYASPNHWFDGGEDRLVSQQGAFKLEAGVATAVQFWYYEADGGEACSINVSTEGGANDKSFGDAGLKLKVDKTVYTSKLAVNHDRVNALLPAGITADGSVATDHNGCQADNAGNHNYESTIEGLMDQMFPVEEKVLPTFETAGFDGLGYCGFEYEDSLIDYTGYITPAITGIYHFGSTKVDNCFFLEIQIDGEWVTAYEFWAKFIWNDNGTTYYNYNESLVLEAGVSYPVHATFLEINGGQAVELVTKIDGEEVNFEASGLALTTEPMEEIPEITTVNFYNTGSEWKYMTSGEGNTVTEAPANWNTDAAVSAEWATGTAPMADEWATADDPVNNKYIWLTKTFEVEDLEAIADWAVMTSMHFDDNIHIYINGVEVFVHGTWNDGYVTYKLSIKASEVLVEGTNLVAVSLVQGFGGYDFDASLYATKEDTSSYLPNIVSISTADQLIDYVAFINASPNQNITKNTTAVLTADIDMTGKDWTPIKRYIGTFDGQGHTISNLSYTATGEQSNVGMFVIDIANDNANGRVKNVVFDNCTLTVATTNDNTYAGLVAAKADRGNLTNVTVKNSKVLGNAMKAGGIVAEICWGIGDGHVIDCTVENTVITASQKAAGLVGRATSGDDTVIRGCTVTDVTYVAPQFADYAADTVEKTIIENCTASGAKVLSTLAAPTEGDYTFYYQTRTGENGTDYRIICVANTEWVTAQSSVSVKISFTDGTDTVSTTQRATTVYNTVLATGDGYTDVYTAAEGAVIFGWVVEGVPADFAANAPTAEVIG